MRCLLSHFSRVQNHSSAHTVTPNVTKLMMSVARASTLQVPKGMHIVCLYVQLFRPQVCGTNTESSVPAPEQ